MTPISERLRQAASYTRSDQMRELLLEAAGMIEGSDSRLYIAVDTLCAQAGTETDETIDWLCDENFGMAKLFEAYFSPKPPAQQPQEFKPLSKVDCLIALEYTAVNDYGLSVAQRVAIVRAVETAHGIDWD